MSAEGVVIKKEKVVKNALNIADVTKILRQWCEKTPIYNY